MRRTALWLSMVVMPCLLPAVAAGDGAGDEMSTVVRQACADLQGPGMAVLVAKGDEVLYRAACGTSSGAGNPALAPEQAFRLASVTKQFTAVGILALVDDGRVDLDDPLSRFLPDYPGGKQITLRHLLTHTAGIANYTAQPGAMDPERLAQPVTTEGLMERFVSVPSDFLPGKGWAYNNSGYVLLGAVIEKVTGQTWADYLHQRLFAQLDLQATGHYGSKAVGGFSQGVTGWEPAMPMHLSNAHAAGGLVGSVDDLLRWNRALHGGQLLSAHQHANLVDVHDGKPTGYAMGIGIQQLRGERVWAHNGGIPGFNTQLMYLPDQSLTVAVLQNQDASAGAEALGRTLAALAISKHRLPSPDASMDDAVLAGAAGVYRSDTGIVRTLRWQDGQLTSQRGEGAVFPLRVWGVDRLGFDQGIAELHLERDADGRLIAIQYLGEETDKPVRHVRTADQPSDLPDVAARFPAQLSRPGNARLLGNYQLGGISLAIASDEKGMMTVRLTGQPALALVQESDALLHVVGVPARLVFTVTGDQATAVTLHQGGQTMPFERVAD